MFQTNKDYSERRTVQSYSRRVWECSDTLIWHIPTSMTVEHRWEFLWEEAEAEQHRRIFLKASWCGRITEICLAYGKRSYMLVISMALKLHQYLHSSISYFASVQFISKKENKPLSQMLTSCEIFLSPTDELQAQCWSACEKRGRGELCQRLIRICC